MRSPLSAVGVISTQPIAVINSTFIKGDEEKLLKDALNVGFDPASAGITFNEAAGQYQYSVSGPISPSEGRQRLLEFSPEIPALEFKQEATAKRTETQRRALQRRNPQVSARAIISQGAVERRARAKSNETLGASQVLGV